jgi:MFS family permease
MPVLVVQLLGATPFEVGVVNAAQFVPYALLGLIAGVYTDRWRRKPVLDGRASGVLSRWAQSRSCG